ncbi:MAG: CinA family protein [Paracoccaceae bacterium]
MDILTLSKTVNQRASQLGKTITTAESCTGGMLAAALTDVPGSSSIFERGYVTYSDAAKIAMLGVSAQVLDTYGAVSENVAQQMATGALSAAQADIAIAITGIAGPGGTDHKPEGLVCFALAQSGHPTHSVTVEFSALGRSRVRTESVLYALGLLIAAL